MLTTRPQPAAIIPGTSARITRNGAVASSSRMRSHIASVVFGERRALGRAGVVDEDVDRVRAEARNASVAARSSEVDDEGDAVDRARPGPRDRARCGRTRPRGAPPRPASRAHRRADPAAAAGDQRHACPRGFGARRGISLYPRPMAAMTIPGAPSPTSMRPRRPRSSAAGPATPRELVDAAIARIESTTPSSARSSCRCTSRRAPTCRGRPARSVPRRADPDQGHLRDGRRRAPGHRALLPLKRARASRSPDDSHLVRSPAPRRVRRSSARPTPPSSASCPSAEPPAWPPTRNPYDPDARLGRLERRLGVRGRGRPGADRPRQRRRRLDPDPGELLRAVRPQAESRARVPRTRTSATSTAGWSYEHVVTRCVRDSAAVLDVLAGMMPGDPYTAPAQLRPTPPS